MPSKIPIESIGYVAAGLEEFTKFAAGISAKCIENLKLAGEVRQDISDYKPKLQASGQQPPTGNEALDELVQGTEEAKNLFLGAVRELKDMTQMTTDSTVEKAYTFIAGYRAAAYIYGNLYELISDLEKEGRLSGSTELKDDVKTRLLGLKELYAKNAEQISGEIKSSKVLSLIKVPLINTEEADKYGPHFAKLGIERVLKAGLVFKKLKDKGVRLELERIAMHMPDIIPKLAG